MKRKLSTPKYRKISLIRLTLPKIGQRKMSRITEYSKICKLIKYNYIFQPKQDHYTLANKFPAGFVLIIRFKWSVNSTLIIDMEIGVKWTFKNAFSGMSSMCHTAQFPILMSVTFQAHVQLGIHSTLERSKLLRFF